ncbi:methyltransferase domain-containing protein [Salinibacterium sp. G-O1]|uniref:class I SAM-dependent methyltransferase n=1 Tax=Salinibacterium sp. G-O1 TaxID=3046208 RepID=UPI0024BB6979|nr:methyltransferase domain-containing protein [Salinibacterium sp. G-O1]MDJ0336128.1 methyltransferase domain-containing protein [Salinibacterium sp. G-O1]
MNGTYERGAPFYDAISGEWPVYRRGRVVGVELLGLNEGDTVLDLGCGTGLNFPLLFAAVGPTGRVIGVDRSPAMLGMADRRIASNRWSNVTTVSADAAKFTASDLGQEQVDAVFATYSLSVIDDWRAAWERMRAVLRPGGRAGIVDMQLPTGAAAILSPLARLACAMGGSDITAHPWTILREAGSDLSEVSVRGGHIVAAAATIP